MATALNGSSILVQWQPPADVSVNPVDGYYVFVSSSTADLGDAHAVSGDRLNTIIERLPTDNTYFVRVRAHTHDGMVSAQASTAALRGAHYC